jgi:hypothetical protein
MHDTKNVGYTHIQHFWDLNATCTFLHSQALSLPTQGSIVFRRAPMSNIRGGLDEWRHLGVEKCLWDSTKKLLEIEKFDYEFREQCHSPPTQKGQTPPWRVGGLDNMLWSCIYTDWSKPSSSIQLFRWGRCQTTTETEENFRTRL